MGYLPKVIADMAHHWHQLMDSKAAELERLLSQLSDVNDSMKGTLGGRSDARSHTLTRHRDILHDYQQVSCTVCLHTDTCQQLPSFTNLWTIFAGISAA